MTIKSPEAYSSSSMLIQAVECLQKQMTHNIKMHSSWADLSEEVLNLAFQQVKDNMQQSSDLYKLALVCTKFRDVLYHSTSMCDTVTLDKLDSEHLLSLVKWLHRHGSHVRVLNGGEGVAVEVVLGMLLAVEAPLHTLRFQVCAQPEYMVSAFRLLKRCSLQCADSLNLKPLEALVSLDDLELTDGTFLSLYAAAVQLTSLRSEFAAVHSEQPCMCVTSLVQLELRYSHLHIIHGMGLCACHQLEQLCCEKSTIGANEQLQCLDFDTDAPQAPFVPAGLSALTKWTEVEFGFSFRRPELTLDWLTCLTTIQQLQVTAHAEVCMEAASIVLPPCFSSMSNLRLLWVAGAKVHERQTVTIKPLFDWKALVLLECLTLLDPVRVSKQFKLSDLASLTRIQELLFIGCDRYDHELAMQLAVLSDALGKSRPDVSFKTDCVLSLV